jgi:integrase
MARARRGRGEGGICQMPSGRWFSEISLGFDGNGKRRRKRIYGDTKADVQAELRKVQEQAGQGRVPNAGSLTVGQVMDRWLEANKPAWAAATHESHSQLNRNHIKPRLGGVRLSLLTALHVQDAMSGFEKDGMSAANRRHVLVTLRGGLGWADEMGLIGSNPAARVPLPQKPAHRSHGLTFDQIGDFLLAAKADRLYPLYVLAVDSGARQGELLGLEWRDVDFNRSAIAIRQSLEEVKGHLRLKPPKTKAGVRTIAISPTALDALQAHRKAMLAEGHCRPDAPVFCGPRQGLHLRKSDIFRRSFAPILNRAKLRFRFHELRHASASLLLADGQDVKTVQARLGHSAAAVTMDIYAHAIDRGQGQAAGRMDSIFKAATDAAEKAAEARKAANGY